MTTISAISVYETNGTETPLGQLGERRLRVESHGIRSGLVILDIDGHRITVAAEQLIAAVRNATNVVRAPCHADVLLEIANR